VAACYSASRVCGLLRAGVAVDVAFGRLDRPMPGEKLNVPQTSPGLVDVPRGDGDEAPPTRMRRAGFKAERLVKRREPIHDAVGLQMRAPIGADHRTYRRAARARQTLKRRRRSGCMGMRRPPRFFAMASRTWIVPHTQPCASRTIDQSRPAISHVRKPALIESRIMARSRAASPGARATSFAPAWHGAWSSCLCSACSFAFSPRRRLQGCRHRGDLQKRRIKRRIVD